MTAYAFHGYRLLTHKYRPGWGHLDDREYVGEFRQLNARTIYHDDDSYTACYTVKAPRRLRHDPSTVADVLYEHYREGCRCEHDCCGHYSGGIHSPTVRRVKGDEWTVEASYYANI